MEHSHPLWANEHKRGEEKASRGPKYKHQHGNPEEATEAWLPTVPQFPVPPHWGQNHSGDQVDKPLRNIKDPNHGGNKSIAHISMLPLKLLVKIFE